MIRSKRFLSTVVLLMSMLLTVFFPLVVFPEAIPTVSEDVEAATIVVHVINGIAYEFPNNKNYVTVANSTVNAAVAEGATPYTGAITIPDTITYGGVTYPVKGINNNAFGNTSITSIRIGRNVERIESSAFYKCTSLTSVTFDANSSCFFIGSAFNQCSSLTSFTFPDSVKYIGTSCFSNCTSLRSVVFPASLLSLSVSSVDSSGNPTIGDGTTTGYFFKGSTALTSIDMSRCVSLTTIPSYMCNGCTLLNNIILPPNLQTIKANAFYTCAQSATTGGTINIPASLRTIESNGFNISASTSRSFTLNFLGTTAPSLSSNALTNSKYLTINYPQNGTGYTPGANNWPNSATYVSGSARVTPTPTRTPATNSPTPTTRPATPTNTPTAIPLPTQPTIVSEEGVAGFIDRIYTIALNRPSDESGKAFWINEVKNNGRTGADIARFFLLSDEFRSKGYDNWNFVNVLYSVFFDRAADDAGRNYWVNNMNSGWSQEQVINSFIDTPEWANICISYGIASGGMGTPTPHYRVVAFATRLFTSCLGRAADQSGLDFWVTSLENRSISGSAAAGNFFFGAEFTGHGYSNAEFVIRLYRTMMGREPDAAGASYWVGNLDRGFSRQDAFNAFTTCPEWVNACNEAGINP